MLSSFCGLWSLKCLWASPAGRAEHESLEFYKGSALQPVASLAQRYGVLHIAELQAQGMAAVGPGALPASVLAGAPPVTMGAT